MHRNLDRRVETMVKIEQNDQKRLLIRAIDTYLSVNTPCWEMNTEGEWEKKNQIFEGKAQLPFHEQVINWYKARV